MTEIQYVLGLLRNKEIKLSQLCAMDKIIDKETNKETKWELSIIKKTRKLLTKQFPEEFI